MNQMKRFILALLMLGCCTFTHAQNSVQSGIKAGLNVATLQVDPGADPVSRTGFSLGVFATYDLTSQEQAFLQPELLYSSIGFEDQRINYLQLPLLLKYYPTTHIHIHTGIQPSLLVGAEDDFDDFLSGGDLGFPVGLGYEAQSFGLGVRYITGLTDIREDDGDLSGFPFRNDDQDWYNRNIQIYVTFQFS